MAEKSSEAKKIIWLLLTMGTLFFLLGIQIIWFVGSTTLKDYQYYQDKYQGVLDEESKIIALNNEKNDIIVANILMNPVTLKKQHFSALVNSTISTIRGWNHLWMWTGCQCGHGPGTDEDDLSEISSASGITQVLGLYILPLLYGCLGALLSIVQKMLDDDSDGAIRKIKPGSRLVAGTVAGPMIGMFISPEILNSLAFQVTPFLIAFLGGYATDVFFTLIDRLLSNFRGALDKAKAKPFADEVALGPQTQVTPKKQASVDDPAIAIQGTS